MNVDFGSLLQAITPEIGLVVLVGLVLVFDLVWHENRARFLGVLTLAGLLIILVLSLVVARPKPEPALIWGGMLRLDQAGFVFRMLFLVGAALTTLFASENEALHSRGEFYALLLVSTLGMSLLALAADLIMVYLAFEVTSIPLYVLAGFLLREEKSVEAGIKYMIYGAATSAVMLFGFSWLYGLTGTTNLYRLAEQLQSGGVSAVLLGAVLVMIAVGFGFKVSAAPFHFWAPDVYEGAPAPVAGFLSTASKAAGFAVLMRVLLTAFPQATLTWTTLVAILAGVSMLVGNLLALAQKNVKRLLAYSSIAQAGYMLIGVAANTPFGNGAAIYYLTAYLFTNLAAFAIVSVVGRAVGSDELNAFAGLSRRSPGLALAMLATMLSLAGIPFFGGFVGKLLVFGAAVDAGMTWLAVVGALNSILALYYYLVVLKVIYLHRSPEEQQPLPVSLGWAVGLVTCVVGMIALGVIIAPWMTWSTQAALAFTLH